MHADEHRWLTLHDLIHQLIYYLRVSAVPKLNRPQLSEEEIKQLMEKGQRNNRSSE